MGRCNKKITQGTTTLKGDSRGYFAKVKFDDTTEGVFIVDTGATLISISAEFASRINHNTTGKFIKAQTANGIVSRELSRVRKVSVGQASTEGLLIGISPNGYGEGIDGLLGMNFLSRFKVEFDPGSNTMTIEAEQ